MYVVGRDDDESIGAGSEIGDDAASWETVEDDDRDALDDSQKVLLPFCIAVFSSFPICKISETSIESPLFRI